MSLASVREAAVGKREEEREGDATRESRGGTAERKRVYFGSFGTGSSFAVLLILGSGVGVLSVSLLALSSSSSRSEESAGSNTSCSTSLRCKRVRSKGARSLIAGASPDEGRDMMEARVEMEDVRTRLKGALNMRCWAYARGRLNIDRKIIRLALRKTMENLHQSERNCHDNLARDARMPATGVYVLQALYVRG